MKKPVPDHLYIATDGEYFKIGITHNPAGRMPQIGATLVKVYMRPYARMLEANIKSAFADCCVSGRGNEWFAVTEAEILKMVRRAVRIVDDDEAMKRGLEPSKRPGPGEPQHEPPFALEWLEQPQEN